MNEKALSLAGKRVVLKIAILNTVLKRGTQAERVKRVNLRNSFSGLEFPPVNCLNSMWIHIGICKKLPDLEDSFGMIWTKKRNQNEFPTFKQRQFENQGDSLISARLRAFTKRAEFSN